MHQKYPIQPGDEFGRLTVLEETGRDRHGHRQYKYQCTCGELGYAISGFLRSNSNVMCRKCARIEAGLARRIELVGKIVNNWEVICEAGKDKHDAIHYLCRCVCCGSEQVKTGSAIRRRKKMAGCRSCFPDYRFRTDGKDAVGTLDDGTEFTIDAEMIPKVSSVRWVRSKGRCPGYIISGYGQSTIYLHRLVLGVQGSERVDHVNRDKADCRRANLRLCTTQQNNWNKSLQRNNTTGYVGVSYIQSKSAYTARIGYNNCDLRLGQYRDIERAAQAHNIAAAFLFGEYAGHVNDVPDPTMEFADTIRGKCHRYLNEMGASCIQSASI